jgi:Neurotransmitter-gated ion-channel ligand binding domain
MRVIILLLFLTQIAVVQCQPTKPSAVAGNKQLETQPESQPKQEDMTSLPLGKGLPVLVRTGLYFQGITDFDDNQGLFTGTVDMRLRWDDSRLRYAAETTPRGFQEFRGPKADEKVKEIWVPEVAFINLKDSPSYQATNLRIFPDGQVELMQRTTGQFVVHTDASDFPFDKERLGVEIAVRRETAGEASQVVLQEDLDFSHAAKDISIDGWTPGHVNVKRTPYQGWYGDFHSGLVVELDVARQYGKVVPIVFIPLLASLLIPLLAIWMNHTEAGEFQIDAFELGNIIVGGLFAVIALNFTINAAYKCIASGDNTVTRLFALNYVTLGVGLAIVVLLYRYNVPMRLGGRHIQEQVFSYLSWAVPLLASCTAIAFMFIAAS